MSASQRVQILSGGAEQLAVLSEYIKNPKLIEQLQDEVKKLNSLTADEESKVAQARKDLRDHAGKMDILQTSMEELAREQEAHKERVNADRSELSLRSESLDSRTKTQSDIDSRQDDKDKSHAEERKQLDAHAIEIQKAADAVNASLSKREAVVKAREDKATSIEIALAAQKKKLDDKLKLLSE